MEVNCPVQAAWFKTSFAHNDSYFSLSRDICHIRGNTLNFLSCSPFRKRVNVLVVEGAEMWRMSCCQLLPRGK